MKKILIILVVMLAGYLPELSAQESKAPASCKVYLNDKVISDVTIADALAWTELTPPTVQCDDGKIYKLETFQINYLTLKPFMNKDFGIGEGGFPILARDAIKNGNVGDTVILKEVTYTDEKGNKNTLPIISIKLK
jgi:hypothetical protein